MSCFFDQEKISFILRTIIHCLIRKSYSLKLDEDLQQCKKILEEDHK